MSRYVAIDVETAQPYDHVIEIGLVEIVDGRLTGREYRQRYNPRSKMNPICQRIHGISLADLAAEPFFEDVVDEVIAFVDEAPLVAHNIAYEFNTLRKEFERFSLPIWDRERYLCTMRMAGTAGHPRALRALCPAIGIPTDHLGERHDALEDARMSAEAFLRLAPPALLQADGLADRGNEPDPLPMPSVPTQAPEPSIAAKPRQATPDPVPAPTAVAKPAPVRTKPAPTPEASPMLDPIQRELLARARDGSVSASGRTGTGKTRLANALAADAAARRLTCLLVGDDAQLDAAMSLAADPEPLDPVLATRHAAPTIAPGMPGWASDPVSLRASIDPKAARQAVGFLARFRAVRAEHGIEDAEIVAAATRRTPSPRTLGLLSVAAQDAARVADVLWGANARPGRTLGEVASVLRGEASGPPADEDGILAATGAPAFAGRVAELDRLAEDASHDRTHLADLRRALDPWAWGNAQSTVAGLHDALRKRHAVFEGAAALLKRHKRIEAAIGAGDPGSHVVLALENFRKSYPDVDGGAAHKRIMERVRSEGTRADALVPFLGRSGHARLADLEALPGAPAVDPALDPGRKAQALRECREAATRLNQAFAELRRAMPRQVVEAIKARPLEDLRDGIGQAAAEEPRLRAARELAGLRTVFTRFGFGDILALPSGFEASVAAARPLPTADGDAPLSPRVLDLLLETPDAAPARPTAPWPTGVERWRPSSGDPIPQGRRWDVVVVDDHSSVPEGAIADLVAAAGVLHAVGVQRGRGVELEYPHRSKSTGLANLGRGAHDPMRAGAPQGAGVVVRTLAPGADIEAAVAEALRMSAAGGLAAADASKGLVEPADVVVLAMDRVTPEQVAEAGSRARLAVVVIARECGWTPPMSPTAAAIPEDERGLAGAGWAIEHEVAEGRIYRNGERSALVMDEPDGFAAHPETVADRARRLAAAGWSPIVAWRGSPRGGEDLLALVEARAVRNGAAMARSLESFPLPSPAPVPPGSGVRNPVRPTAYARPPIEVGEVPASPHAPRTFEDVVWRLKWIREERLLPANRDAKACLLTDARIAALIRMDVTDDQDWQDRFRGVIRHGIDPAQLVARERVYEIVDTMPAANVRGWTPEQVAAVAYARPVPEPAPAAPAPQIRIEAIPRPVPRPAVRPGLPVFRVREATPIPPPDAAFVHEAPRPLM